MLSERTQLGWIADTQQDLELPPLATLVEIVALPPDNDMYKSGERSKCRYRIDL